MSKNFKKKTSIFTALILSLILLLQPFGVYAAISEPDVEIQWQHVNTIGINLDTANSNFLITVRSTADSGCYYKNGILSFRKLDGNDAGLIQTWLKLSSSTNLFTFRDNSIPYAPGTYRITFSATVVDSNGYMEMVREYMDFTI